MLSLERYAMLQSIDFTFNTYDAIWDNKYAELRRFHEKHGHCNVPYDYDQSRNLYSWVKTQRRQYQLLRANQRSTEAETEDGTSSGNLPGSIVKTIPLTEERISKLESLNFAWYPSGNY